MTVALVSKNSWVIGLSIFIGGLIVASEDFMKFLAAVMRTNSDKVAETINALVTKASKEEKELSITNEVVETKAAETITAEETINSDNTKKETTPLKMEFSKENKIIPKTFDRVTYSTLLPMLELGTLRYIFKFMSGFEKLEENIRVGSYVFDGYALNKNGRPYFLEVKVFPNVTDSHGNILVSQIITRLALWLPKIIVSFDSLPQSKNHLRPVLIVNLAINAFGDLSEVKKHVKKLQFRNLSNNVIIKFQYLNLPDLMEKSAFLLSQNPEK